MGRVRAPVGLPSVSRLLLLVGMAAVLASGCSRAPEPEPSPGPTPRRLAPILYEPVLELFEEGPELSGTEALAYETLHEAMAAALAPRGEGTSFSDIMPTIYSIIGVLARVDPERALAMLEAEVGTPATVWEEQRARVAVACELGLRDFDRGDALVLKPESLHRDAVQYYRDYLRVALPILAKTDPDRALEVARRYYTAETAGLIAPVFAERYPDRMSEVYALAYVPEEREQSRQVFHESREGAFEFIGYRLAKADPGRNLPLITDIDNVEYRDSSVKGAIRVVASKDPELALQLAYSIADPYTRSRAYGWIVFASWRTDPGFATHVLRLMDDDERTAQAIYSFLEEVAAERPALADEWMRLLKDEDARLYLKPELARGLAYRDPEAALALAEDMGDRFRQSLVITIIAPLAARSDTAAAMSLLDSVGVISSRDRASAVANIIAEVARVDAKRAARVFTDEPSPRTRLTIARALSERIEDVDPDVAREIIGSLRDEPRAEDAVVALSDALADHDVDSALEFCRSIERPYTRARALLAVATKLVPRPACEWTSYWIRGDSEGPI